MFGDADNDGVAVKEDGEVDVVPVLVMLPLSVLIPSFALLIQNS